MSMRRRRTPATAHVQFSETAGKIKLANIQKIIMDSVGDKDLLEGRDSERFGEQGSLPRFLPHHIKIMKVALVGPTEYIHNVKYDICSVCVCVFV